MEHVDDAGDTGAGDDIADVDDNDEACEASAEADRVMIRLNATTTGGLAPPPPIFVDDETLLPPPSVASLESDDAAPDDEKLVW